MYHVLISLLAGLMSTLRTRASLQFEILALRHQLTVLQRNRKRQISLRACDRILWVALARLWPDWRKALRPVKPETVISWHGRGFRFYWTWKSRRGRIGRPGISKEVRDLIRNMSSANVLWEAPRLHAELLKLGIEVSQATVAKHMVKHRKPPSPTWRTFLENHVKQLVSVDFFVVPTLSFSILYVFVIQTHDRRRVVHFNVTEHPTVEWTAAHLMQAFPWDTAPCYLLRDRDRIYGDAFRRQAANMLFTEVLTAPRSPWQSPYVERLIGSIRRECLDHVVVLSRESLRQILRSDIAYYHDSRCHLSLDKDSPETREVQPPSRGIVVEIPRVGGLHHRYERRAA
jgi:putative transposase